MNHLFNLKTAAEIQLEQQAQKLDQDIRSRINFARGGYTPEEVYKLMLKFAKEHNIKGLA